MRSNNVKKLQAVSLILSGVILLGGCQPYETPQPYIQEMAVVPNRVVKEILPVPQKTVPVKASFGVAENPAVLKAYQDYIKKGNAVDVSGEGFKTLAFDPYAHPLVDCSPLTLCVIQLEEGEVINNINIADRTHWVIELSHVGTKSKGSAQITLTPTQVGVASDLVVSTSRRTYNIGLVSRAQATTHVVNFYYPSESLQVQLDSLAVFEKDAVPGKRSVVSQSTAIHLDQVNFNYAVGGDRTLWRPSRVFDDGEKTFIELPQNVRHTDLPVLYLVDHGDKSLVNYRYQSPYIIIDGFFEKAYLISGKGHHQEKVLIVNRHWGKYT